MDHELMLPDIDSIPLYREEPIPVIVVTGFLGAGKTTFINQYLSANRSDDTAIIVNEFGEIGLDHLIIETASDDIILMENGCLCCAASGDLEKALMTLFEKRERSELPRYSRVIIETSGLANPEPVISELISDTLKLSPYRYRGMVSILDAETFLDSYSEYSEARLQLIHSDKVLINKSVNVSDETVNLIQDEVLKTKGEAAPVLDRCEFAEALILDAIDDWRDERVIGLNDNGSSEQTHRDNIFSLSRQTYKAIDHASLVSFSNDLVGKFPEELLRVKIIVPDSAGEGYALIQAVRGRWFPQTVIACNDSRRKASIVVIGKSGCRREVASMVAELFN